MPPIFQTYKKQIDGYLLRYLNSKESVYTDVNHHGPDLIGRLKKIVTAGKTIRGSLVLLTYGFTHKEISEDALKAAAAMELIQTALVVHDDIMDGDDVRRGIPTLHVQYKSESMAMCAGDILFFMAFELLGSIKTDAATFGRIIRLVGREYQNVGLAQMADVDKLPKNKPETFSLYTNKTARYTFALPLMLGATLAGTTKETLRYLESYGVAVGVLFQIQDDKLDNEKNPFTETDILGLQKSAEESVTRLQISGANKKILRDLLEFSYTRNT